MIARANGLYLGPALWHALNRKGLLDSPPKDARDFLAESYRLNGRRNERIKEQALEIAARFTEAGIQTIVLKGGAFLFDCADEDLGCRMMVDLDLLIPEKKLDQGVSLLHELGYKTVTHIEATWTYHLPPLVREGEVAIVELHQDVGEQRDLLRAGTAFRDARPVRTAPGEIMALSPTHRVIHNVFHSEIQDRHHELGLISLKQLYDFGLIRQAHEDAIDWAVVRSALVGRGFGSVLESYMYLADRLLALPQPSQIPVTRRAKLHYHRCIAQIRWQALNVPLRLWAVATHPFQRCRIEYIYGSDQNWFRLTFNRIRRGWALTRRYKWAIFRRIHMIYRDLY
jgi:hypothetical protein